MLTKSTKSVWPHCSGDHVHNVHKVMRVGGCGKPLAWFDPGTSVENKGRKEYALYKKSEFTKSTIHICSSYLKYWDDKMNILGKVFLFLPENVQQWRGMIKDRKNWFLGPNLNLLIRILNAKEWWRPVCNKNRTFKFMKICFLKSIIRYNYK